MAHKKGGGSSHNGRDSNAQRLGVKRYGGQLVNAFASVGWKWGGTWSAPDYQHFSSTGN